MTDPEYRKVSYDQGDADSSASDRVERWRDYLNVRQGPVGLGLHETDFHSDAVAHAVGEYQAVRFDTSAVDYHRRYRDIRDDNGLRVLLLLEGMFKLEQGDTREVFRKGMVGLIDWHKPLYMTHSENIRAVIMTVPEDSIRLPKSKDLPLALDTRRSIVGSIHDLVRRLGDTEQHWTTSDFYYTYSSALKLLEGALNPDQPVSLGGQGVNAERARIALDLMKIRAKDPLVTPEDIAADCNMSLGTLHNILKASAGLTPGAMLRKFRLDIAKERVATPLAVDLEEIASQSGFTTTKRFREAFQREFGKTPTQLREELFGVGKTWTFDRST